MKFYEKTYFIILYTSYILYAITIFGIWDKAPEYYESLNYYLKIYVSIILIYFFNPFFKQEMNKFHRDVAFSAGIFLLTTTSITSFIKNIKTSEKQIRDLIKTPPSEMIFK